MHSIMVRQIEDGQSGNASALALDIATPGDAWRIAANIASSYDRHGVSSGADAFWFKSSSGLYYIWAELS